MSDLHGERRDDRLIDELIREVRDSEARSKEWRDQHDKDSKLWRDSIDRRLAPVEDFVKNAGFFKTSVIAVITLAWPAYKLVRLIAEHLR